ncbi:hypothetical protein PINS_up006745 [Pythium insidiosum]|nr:hypothetical protein PINS_up006745 [Pythium insidiosum]
MTFGTVLGTLEDAMYGVLNPTTSLMRLKSSYVQDAIVNGAVLATLEEPTPVTPFQSLTVKWLVKGQPLHFRTLVKNREFVYLEATGMAQLSTTGERVGFQLLHSIEFPETQPIDLTRRGHLSICGFWRQIEPNRVETYVRGFFDPKGRVLRPFVVKSGAEALMSVLKNVYCGQMKKLAWFREHPEQLITRMSMHGTIDVCGACSSGISASMTVRRRHCCQICRRSVCSSCRVKKKMSALERDGHVVRQRMSFCVACINAATRADAGEIAAEEAKRRLSLTRRKSVRRVESSVISLTDDEL